MEHANLIRELAQRLGSPEAAIAERGSFRTVGDVDRLGFAVLGDLVDLSKNPSVVETARRLALGLMRKGRGMMGRYHDFSLVDDVFSLLEELQPN